MIAKCSVMEKSRNQRMLADVLPTADSREHISALERRLVGTEKPCDLFDVHTTLKWTCAWVGPMAGYVERV